MTWLAEKTNTEISIESIRVHFPLRIEITEVHVGEMLKIESLCTRLLLRPLTKGTIKARHAEVQGLYLGIKEDGNTFQTDIIVQHLSAKNFTYTWEKREAHIHRLVLKEGDARIQQREPTSPKSPTAVRLPLALTISELLLHHTTTNYTSKRLHLEASAERIVLNDIVADTTMAIALNNIALHNGTATLTQDSREPWTFAALTAQAQSVYYNPTTLSGKLSHLSFKGPQGLQLEEGKMTFAWHDGQFNIPHFILRTNHSSLHGQWRKSISTQSMEGNADITIGHADAIRLAQWLSNTPDDVIRNFPAETLTASLVWNGSIEHLVLTRCSLSLPSAFDIDIEGTIQHINVLRQCRAQCHVKGYAHNLDFLTSLADNTTPEGFSIPHDIACVGDLFYAPDTLHTQCTLNVGTGTLRIRGGIAPTKGSYSLQVWADSLDIGSFISDRKLGDISLQGHLAGCRIKSTTEYTSLYGELELSFLEWADYTFTNASVEVSLRDRYLTAKAAYGDSLMRWRLTANIAQQTYDTDVQLHLQLDDINLRALGITNTDIRPSFECHATLQANSAMAYSLDSRFSNITLSTPTQALRPKALDMHVALTTDTALLSISSGDLNLITHAHIDGLPWQWRKASGKVYSDYITDLHAVLSAGNDNPMTNYLALRGMKVGALHATVDDLHGEPLVHINLESIAMKRFSTDSTTVRARVTSGTMHAKLSTAMMTWKTEQMSLQGKADATFTLDAPLAIGNLSGVLQLSDIRYDMPAYSLLVHTPDTLLIPLERGELVFDDLPLYTRDKHPLLVDGRIMLRDSSPTLQLKLTARETSLLQTGRLRTTRLYGKALVSGTLMLRGAFDALSLTGDLRLRPSTTLHYIYKNVQLTANNQLENIVTFVRLDTDTISKLQPRKGPSSRQFTMNLNITIDPTAQLEIILGTSQQNTLILQGGGVLNLQYIPTGEWRLAGRYTIEEGELNVNIPLLNVNHMVIRAGSTVTWSGNPRNPQLGITAEERIRASVTLDGNPQTVLFVTGISITDTMEKPNIQFTLSTPENASMQNTLASLSSDERNKLCVALLTTGLYIGEGGTGNLMNTAIMSILQSQIDGISREAFRAIDVSVGIEPLPDGVSGISTRTDYSFSLAKRLWNDRIRIVLGGSVTTSNERIEENAVIDNISIEWRISPVGNQYLRFFYDQNYESILEGKIRVAGVGYVYQKQFNK